MLPGNMGCPCLRPVVGGVDIPNTHNHFTAQRSKGMMSFKRKGARHGWQTLSRPAKEATCESPTHACRGGTAKVTCLQCSGQPEWLQRKTGWRCRWHMRNCSLQTPAAASNSPQREPLLDPALPPSARTKLPLATRYLESVPRGEVVNSLLARDWGRRDPQRIANVAHFLVQ